ncbi:MAG: hypothetical protein J5777_03305 [Clostridiales bacterium]|nr:hypothetical protein [Clostridiales bacterium]
MDNEKWICACGQENDGKFCIQCGAPKPEAAPAASPAAPAEAVAPAVAPIEPVAPAVAPIEPVAPAAAPVEAAAPVAPAVAPIEPAAPAVAPIEPAPAAPVAAAAVIAAATPDEEPVQVIKCQPMPETPMEDYASVPSDPEFADAEAVPVQPVYQPAPVAAPVEVEPVAPAAPKQVGPVSYQNTASNPYSEPDRASHNPYAPAPVAQPQANYGGGYAAPAAAATTASTGTGLLILGIVAVVLAFDVTLGAIICGAIGCNWAKKFKLPNGEFTTGKAKIGALLSKIGLIIGIVTSIIAVIICIIVVIGIIAGAGYAATH